jgi:hypothetical protein
MYVRAYLGGCRRVRVSRERKATGGEQIHHHYHLRGLSTTFCSWVGGRIRMSKKAPPHNFWNRFPHVSMHVICDVCGSTETAFPVPYEAVYMCYWAPVTVHLARAHLPCRSLLWTEEMTCMGLCYCVGDWGAHASCRTRIHWGHGVHRRIGLDAIDVKRMCLVGHFKQ